MRTSKDPCGELSCDTILLSKNKLFELLLLVFVLFFTSGCNSSNAPPQAKNGSVDLRNWRFTEQGPAQLVGEWQLYRGKLLTPEDVAHLEADGVGILPTTWSAKEEQEDSLPRYGEATYVLRVKVESGPQHLALMIKGPLAVGRVYVNGRELGATGVVGTSKEFEKPESFLLTPSFWVGEDTITIVLQISNHHNSKGGLNNPVLLGTKQQIESLLFRKASIAAVLGGTLALIGIAHLFLYSLLKVQRSNLYFGLFCIMWSLAILAGETWGFVIDRLLPFLPWEATFYLALIPYGFTVPLLVMFYHSIIDKRYAIYFKGYFQCIGGMYIGYLIFNPLNAYGDIVVLYCMAAMTVIPYLLFNLAVDLYNKRAEAKMLLPGFLFFVLADVLEKLVDYHLLNQGLFAAVGTLGFVVSYSLVLAVRFSRSIKTELALSPITVMEGVEPAGHTSLVQKNSNDKTADKRSLCVQLMNHILTCWHDCTGGSKADLAHQTGLWKVYVDRNGWERTQTLDKYLEQATIPENPRYKTVIQTAEYVLLHCEKSPCHHEIKQKLLELRNIDKIACIYPENQ